MPDSWASFSLYVVSPLSVHVIFQCSLSRRGARLLTWRLQFSKNAKTEAARPVKRRPALARCRVRHLLLVKSSFSEGGASARCEWASVGQSPALALTASCPSYTHPCKSHPNMASKAGTSSPKSGAGMEGPPWGQCSMHLPRCRDRWRRTVNLPPLTPYVIVRETGNRHSTPLCKGGTRGRERLLSCSSWHLSQLA